MHTSGQVPVLQLPTDAFHPSSRLARVVALVALLVFVGFSGVWAYRMTQKEAELARFRSAMQELTSTVRAMRAQASAKRRTVQLHIDASHGAFQVISIRRGPHRLDETLEQTLWLPDGLQISDGPPTLTALPNGRLSPATIVVTAPAYQRLFRLTTRASGVVQLDEEPTL